MQSHLVQCSKQCFLTENIRKKTIEILIVFRLVFRQQAFKKYNVKHIDNKFFYRNVAHLAKIKSPDGRYIYRLCGCCRFYGTNGVWLEGRYKLKRCLPI